MIEKQIRELDEVDKDLLRLKLEKPGRTLLELGELVGMNWRQVYRRYKREIFQKALYEYQKHALDIVKDARDKAARKLVKLIDSEEDSIALKACISIIADVLPDQKIKVRHEGSVSYISKIGQDGQVSISEVEEMRKN